MAGRDNPINISDDESSSKKQDEQQGVSSKTEVDLSLKDIVSI